MRLRLANAPRNYCATLDKGVLRFRHPWVLGEDNKGKWVRIGVAKHTPIEQGQLLEDAQKLLKKAPSDKTDAPAIDRDVSDPYAAVKPPRSRGMRSILISVSCMC